MANSHHLLHGATIVLPAGLHVWSGNQHIAVLSAGEFPASSPVELRQPLERDWLETPRNPHYQVMHPLDYVELTVTIRVPVRKLTAPL